MIESCTRRQMVTSISILIGITIVFVVVESILTTSSESHRRSTASELASNLSLQENCWLREQYEQLEDCQPCSDLELKSGSPLPCSSAQYRQKIKCVTTGQVYRRCDRAVWVEERHFLLFELSCLVISIAGYAFTAHRQTTLQDRVLARISQQLAAGV